MVKSRAMNVECQLSLLAFCVCLFCVNMCMSVCVCAGYVWVQLGHILLLITNPLMTVCNLCLCSVAFYQQAGQVPSLSPLVSIIPPQCIFVNHSVSFSLARSLSFSCWHFCGPKVQIVVISQEHLQLFVSWANDVSSGHLRIRSLDSLCSSELLGISEKRRETQECKIRAWTHKGTSNPPGVSAVKGKWLIRLLKLRLDILQ